MFKFRDEAGKSLSDVTDTTAEQLEVARLIIWSFNADATIFETNFGQVELNIVLGTKRSDFD